MPWLLKWEGGYDNDPDDPGGETKYGIDKRSHPKEDIRNLTKERATQIYWEEYWLRPNSCDNYKPGMGEVIFNCRVNAGLGRVNKILATGASTPKAFLDQMDAFYRRLATARPKSRKYLKGWLNRTNDLRRWLKV